MTPFPSICLHIGAHKTATTHLQNSLAGASAELAAAGVMFYGPRDFRWGKPTLQKRFDIGNRPQDEAPLSDPKAFDGLLAGADRLVLSEENFSGTLLNGFGRIRKPLYKDLPRRLALLSERSGRPLDLALGIRNPATLLNSAYSQLLFSDRPIALGDYRAKNGLDRVNWVDLAERVLACTGVRSLTVWRYEDYTALFPSIVQHLTGLSTPPVQSLPLRMHQSLSAKAVDAVLTSGLPAKDAMERFPVGPDHAPFDAYDAETHDVSSEYYEAQIAQLDAMPRVSRLTPT